MEREYAVCSKGSSTTIINPDPGLVLVTDSRTLHVMLHVPCCTGRHGHVMSSEVLGAQQEACFHHKISFLGDVRVSGPAEKTVTDYERTSGIHHPVFFP